MLRCTCLLKLRFSLDLCPGMGLLGPVVLLSLVFDETSSCSPLWISWLSFPPTGRRVLFLRSLSSTCCCRFSMKTFLTCVRWCHSVLLIGSSLILIDPEHLFMCFKPISLSSVEKGPFKSCAPIWLGCLLDVEVHKLFVCFGEKFLVSIFVCTYWFHYEVYLFVVFMISSAVPVLLWGVRSYLFIYLLYFLWF